MAALANCRDHVFTHSFIQQMFMEHLEGTRLICEIGHRMLRKQRQKEGFCSQKAYSLVEEVNNQEIT